MNTIKLNTIGILSGGGNAGGGGNSGGGGGNTPAPSGGAVNFKDYDGTILYSFTKDAFLALAEMPTLPTRQGLTCQGWNWTLEDAKAYVGEYGVLDIGATYITDDGKTRLYITIAAEGRMDVPLYFSQTLANGVTIDWGDGSATQTLSGSGNVNTTHHYNEIGDYVISLDVADGCTLGLGHKSPLYCVMGSVDDYVKVYINMLQKVEIGKGVTSIGSYAFLQCYSLASVVIPQGVTSIEGNAFDNCYSLASVVIPQKVTSIGSYAFGTCYSLASVVIPQGVTSIGNSAFSNCYSLASVVIPEGVTRIEHSAFSKCYSLASVVIPQKVTRIENYAFQYCYSLASVEIGKGVTIFEGNAFSNCYSLASVVIPQKVTRIENYAFYNCYGMAYFDFRQHTSVPTLANYSVFSSIASDCKIVVPDELYDSWIAATNWSNSSVASKIVKASEFNG